MAQWGYDNSAKLTKYHARMTNLLVGVAEGLDDGKFVGLAVGLSEGFEEGELVGLDVGFLQQKQLQIH